MEAYKRGSHTVWDCKYHVVWVTKYRHPVLGGDVGQRCRELLRETARAHEIMIHAGGDSYFDQNQSRSMAPRADRLRRRGQVWKCAWVRELLPSILAWPMACCPIARDSFVSSDIKGTPNLWLAMSGETGSAKTARISV